MGSRRNLCSARCHEGQTYSYNPASQIVQRTSTNDAYAWTGAVNGSTGYTPDGLNRYATINGVVPGYDPRGNLTTLNGRTYSYSSENELATVVAGTTHRYNYDALHRLVYDPSVATRLLNDSDETIAEYTGATLARRYVFGPAVDEPLVWYEGAGIADRRWLHADERGSITKISNASSSAIAIDAYDEYGVPKGTNIGRFQYTGQQWLADSAMYYYKARMYVPGIGRFAQIDPIGYDNGPNWYNYVGSDPVNNVDPLGLDDNDEVVVTGTRCDALCRLLRRIGIEGAQRGSTSHSTGGGNGGGTQKTPARKSVPCSQLAGQAGNVLVSQFSGVVAVIGGVTGSVGTFTNLKTGASGGLWSAGGALGWEQSGGGTHAIYSSINDIPGLNVSLNLQLGPVAASFSFSYNSEQGLHLAAIPVGGAAPVLPAGASVTATGTRLYDCSIPG